jgi:hypothetical protein
MKLIDLLYESTASAEAKKRGLKSIGFGRYTDPKTGKVVAKSERGRLVAVKPTDDPGADRDPFSRIPEDPAYLQKLKGKKEQHPEVPFFQVGTKSDIPEMTPRERWKISTRIDRVAELTKKAKEQGREPPDINLCKISIPGTNLYCDNNLGVPRDQMPQFKGKPVPNSPADSLPKGREGQVDTEPFFRELLKRKGVKVETTTVPSDQLKATQSELVGAKVAGMTKALEQNPEHPNINAPIYVSRDGYVIDGHHRWAAVTTHAVKTGKPTNMKVNVIDADAKDIVPLANDFAQEMGIAAKKAAATEGVLRLKDLVEGIYSKWARSTHPMLKPLYSKHDKIKSAMAGSSTRPAVTRQLNRIKALRRDVAASKIIKQSLKKVDKNIAKAEDTIAEEDYKRAKILLDFALSYLHDILDETGASL